jgi:hypothetical protein
MSNGGSVLEEFVQAVLGSWTALELAVGHFGGNFRDAQTTRLLLVESLSDALRSDQYDVNDIAEFLNLFFFDEFSTELEDGSQLEVAHVLMNGWNMIKQGIRPCIASKESGARVSTVSDAVEESSDIEDGDETVGAASHSTIGARIVTDEDGWSTVIARVTRP